MLLIGAAVGTPGSNINVPVYFTPSPDLGTDSIGLYLALPPHVTLLSATPASLGPPAIDAGDALAFNSGLGQLLLYNFSDAILGPGQILTLQLHIDSGIPGGAGSITAFYAGAAGTSVNTAGSGTTVTIPMTVLNGAAIVNGPPPSPNLTLTKNSNIANAKSGNTVTYTIQYQNTTSVAALNSIITDPVPAGTTLVTGSISNSGTVTGSTVTWNLGTVAAGAAGSVSFQAIVN